MPRTIKTETTVYRFEELSDAAKRAAIRNISEMLSTWDQNDIDRMNETITYALADALKSPGWDTYGEGDFPGIDGCKVTGWDLDRGQKLDVVGTLNRDNAPALPWTYVIDYVHLTEQRIGNGIDVRLDTDQIDDWDTPANERAANAMEQAVKDAIRAAWKAGREEMEHQYSDEYATDWIDGNQPEFTVDGVLYR